MTRDYKPVNTKKNKDMGLFTFLVGAFILPFIGYKFISEAESDEDRSYGKIFMAAGLTIWALLAIVAAVL